MKFTRLLFVLLILSIPVKSQDGKRLVIIHTNDMHSRLTGFAPESAYSPLVTGNDQTRGGFARIASVIRSEREKNPENTLVIDGGDFLMGTLFHTVEAETGFQLPLMKRMGYDVVCLGNHEFDFGLEKIFQILTTSAKNGPMPLMLLGNAEQDQSDPRDDSFISLYDNRMLNHTSILSTGGIKTGVFSLMGENAAEVAPYSAPLKITDQKKFAQEAVSLLKSQGCLLIICVSHSGLKKNKDGSWTGEDAELAEKVEGIDVIISGHTHSRLEQPLMIGKVPVVQAGEYGKDAGRLEIELGPTGIKVIDYRLIPVDDRIAGDQKTNDDISRQKDVITGKILAPLGMSYDNPVVETSFPVICDDQSDLWQSNLGPLVADAIRFYINRHSKEGADVSMVSAGVIRDRIMPGQQSASDLFRVMPLGSGKDKVPGYAFSRLYVNGRELKNIIEILLVAQKSNSDYHCFFSGMKVGFDPGKGLLKKIKYIDIVKQDGSLERVSFSKKDKTIYSITANSYMLEFIGIISKKTMGLVKVVPKSSTGERVTDMKTAIVDINEEMPGVQEGKEWLALIEYLGSMKDTNGNGVPDIDNRYSKPGEVFTNIKLK
ncbi:MAG: 5'-nucleotidase C-terminal domain-containing protein [Bacteroidales bacterium]